MDQIKLSRTLVAGASYYAGVGGIAPDGSVTQAQLTVQMASAYNEAAQNVRDNTYYNTSIMLEDQSDLALDNMSLAIDALVDATATFATVGAVAEMAAEADTAQEQLDLQEVLSVSGDITEADVEEYNTALSDVESYAQEAAGFLAASNNAEITSGTDNWAANSNISIASYSSVTYDATTDLLMMDFYDQSTGQWGGVAFDGYLGGDFKTADDIYNTGLAYGG